LHFENFSYEEEECSSNDHKHRHGFDQKRIILCIDEYGIVKKIPHRG